MRNRFSIKLVRRNPKPSPEHQERMEKAVADIHLMRYDEDEDDYFCICREKGTEKFLPLNEWTGVQLNAKGQVIEIYWYELECKGKFVWHFLPPTLEKFTAEDCMGFSGTLPLAQLPRGLRSFEMRKCYGIKGKIDLFDLPETIECFEVEECDLHGMLQMQELPETLCEMSLQGNRDLHGPLDLRTLPKKMYYLNLTECQFSTDILLSESMPCTVRLCDNPIDKKALLKNCGCKTAAYRIDDEEYILDENYVPVDGYPTQYLIKKDTDVVMAEITNWKPVAEEMLQRICIVNKESADKGLLPRWGPKEEKLFKKRHSLNKFLPDVVSGYGGLI